MINKNVADYTNFDGAKTNKRIVQAPGGSSSISLGWGSNQTNNMNSHQYDKNGYNYNQQNKNTMKKKEKEQLQYNVIGTSNNQYGYNNPQSNYQARNNKNNSRQNSRNPIIGGQYGYNNYNGGDYEQSKKYQANQYNQKSNTGSNQKRDFHQMGNQKVDPMSIYKPSSSSKKTTQQQYDLALEQQKYRVQSSKNQRSNNPYPQRSDNADEGKPCVKIHQQKQSSIFGDEYNYWKQDGHKQTAINRQNKTTNFNQPNNNQQYNIITGQNKVNRNSYQKQTQNYAYNNGPNQKQNGKVNVPPGGKSNFTFG